MGFSAAAMIGMAVASAASSAYSTDQQRKSAHAAMDQASQQADAQAKAADQQMNAANQKKPDTSAILSAIQQQGKGGVSGTMLTGPQGIDLSQLNLGKSTLLGGG